MMPKEAEKRILGEGWYFDSWAGSHKHYKHPTKPGKITIPFHKRPKDLPKDLRPKTLDSILKQAGLK